MGDPAFIISISVSIGLIIDADSLTKKHCRWASLTAIAALFIALAIIPMTVDIFSFAMGSLWLATVPFRSGLVAHVFGLSLIGAFYRIVIFSQ
jgi:hypothetical protein